MYHPTFIHIKLKWSLKTRYASYWEILIGLSHHVKNDTLVDERVLSLSSFSDSISFYCTISIYTMIWNIFKQILSGTFPLKSMNYSSVTQSTEHNCSLLSMSCWTIADRRLCWYLLHHGSIHCKIHNIIIIEFTRTTVVAGCKSRLIILAPHMYIYKCTCRYTSLAMYRSSWLFRREIGATIFSRSCWKVRERWRYQRQSSWILCSGIKVSLTFYCNLVCYGNIIHLI